MIEFNGVNAEDKKIASKYQVVQDPEYNVYRVDGEVQSEVNEIPSGKFFGSVDKRNWTKTLKATADINERNIFNLEALKREAESRLNRYRA